jgi:hypothetical protein
MVRSRASLLAGAVSLATILALVGCDDTNVDLVVADDAGGDTDADTDTDTDADTDTGTDSLPDVVTAQILVPPWFSATPARITTSFFSEEHMPPAGPPDGVGASYDFPEITIQPDPPYVLWTPQPPLQGPYYLVVTLFVEGGGTDVPVPGTDWVGSSFNPVVIGPGTGTVDALQIQLSLAPP